MNRYQHMRKEVNEKTTNLITLVIRITPIVGAILLVLVFFQFISFLWLILLIILAIGIINLGAIIIEQKVKKKYFRDNKDIYEHLGHRNKL